MSSEPSARSLRKRLLVSFFLLSGTHLTAASQRVRPASTAINRWEGLRAQIEQSLARDGLECPEEHNKIDVVDASDLTDFSYALVDYCHLGAYTDSIVVMHLGAGGPVVSQFRRANGAMLNVEFPSGSSVMHWVDVKLMPEKKAVVSMAADNDAKGRLAKCGATAYAWNPRVNAFQENPQLSREATRSYCRAERKNRAELH